MCWLYAAVACAVAVAAVQDDGASTSQLPEISNIDVWPLPQSARGGSGVARVSATSFRFAMFDAEELAAAAEAGGEQRCGSLVAAAVQRLRRTMFVAERTTHPYRRASIPPIVNGSTALDALLAVAGVTNPLAQLVEFEQLEIVRPTQQRPRCGALRAEDLMSASEGYTLELGLRHGTLTAETELGLLRGLETFSQLVRWMGSELQYALGPLPLEIRDAPRFAWRGLMVDTARHFLPLGHIFRTLDGMAAMKLNVFHWHFSDAQSFSYVWLVCWSRGAVTRRP
jgi:hypothetical protein